MSVQPGAARLVLIVLFFAAWLEIGQAGVDRLLDGRLVSGAVLVAVSCIPLGGEYLVRKYMRDKRGERAFDRMP